MKQSDAGDVARAILALSYLDMTDVAKSLCGTIKQRIEDQENPDLTDRDVMADILRWWAECRIDAMENER